MNVKLQVFIMYLAVLISTPLIAQANFRKSDIIALENNRVSLNMLEGSIVVVSILNFEDIDEILKLDKLAGEFKNENVVFIAITDDEIVRGEENLLKQRFLNFQYVSKEGNKRIFDSYQTGMFKTFPIYIVMDETGEVKYKKKGSIKNMEEKLTKRINTLQKFNPNDSKEVSPQYTIN